jgi:transcriptional regulator with XRE-family HTH domain
MSASHFQTGMFRVDQLEEKRSVAGKSETLFILGMRLRAARKQLGLERKDIAGRCGSNPDELGRFEHAIGDINFSTLKQLCAVLKVDMLQLLADCMDVQMATIISIVAISDSWKGKPLKVEDVLNFAHSDGW